MFRSECLPHFERLSMWTCDGCVGWKKAIPKCCLVNFDYNDVRAFHGSIRTIENILPSNVHPNDAKYFNIGMRIVCVCVWLCICVCYFLRKHKRSGCRERVANALNAKHAQMFRFTNQTSYGFICACALTWTWTWTWNEQSISHCT